jgi:hypothetical protein
MAQRFQPVRAVILKLTPADAVTLHGQLNELSPADVVAMLPGDEDPRAIGAVRRVVAKIGPGTNKLTIYEARVITELLVRLEATANVSHIATRLGVELARQGGAKVGRR